MLTQFIYIPHDWIRVDWEARVGGSGEGEGKDAISAMLSP